MNNKFNNDLAFGNKGERIFAKYLERKGYTILGFNDDYKYDILAEFKSHKVKFEVKYDRYKSNNFVLELFDCRRLKPTGLSCTEADFFVTIFEHEQEMWIIKTEELKEIAKQSARKSTIIGGGDDNKTVMLLLDKLTHKCKFTVKKPQGSEKPQEPKNHEPQKTTAST